MLCRRQRISLTLQPWSAVQTSINFVNLRPGSWTGNRLPLSRELHLINLRMWFLISVDIGDKRTKFSDFMSPPSNPLSCHRGSIKLGSTAIGFGVTESPELELKAPAVSLVPDQGRTDSAASSTQKGILSYSQSYLRRTAVSLHISDFR